jgi:hypothetical protein
MKPFQQTADRRALATTFHGIGGRSIQRLSDVGVSEPTYHIAGGKDVAGVGDQDQAVAHAFVVEGSDAAEGGSQRLIAGLQGVAGMQAAGVNDARTQYPHPTVELDLETEQAFQRCHRVSACEPMIWIGDQYTHGHFAGKAGAGRSGTMGAYRKRARSPDLITATEIASFVYCPEQWRLQYGVGLAAENRASLAAGDRHHAWKALTERLASLVIGLGRVLIVIAVLLLVLWLASR